MSADITIGVLLFFGNIVVLAVLAYKVVKFSELEEDYQNPTDFARDMNRVFPFELGLQGTLFSLQLINTIALFSSLQLLILIIHTAYFGYHLNMFLDNKWKVDAASVWGMNFKSKMKKTIFGGLAFAGSCFFLYLYNMIRALTPAASK